MSLTILSDETSIHLGRLGGLFFYDLYSCPTRLWLSHKNIDAGKDNEHILLGKHIDETTFKQERKEMTFHGYAAIDFIKTPNGMEIHEVKKGKGEHPEPHIAQVRYYIELFYEMTGKEATGVIHYPVVRKTLEVKRDQESVMADIEKIKNILGESCPKLSRIPICRGCRYEEMCWA
ncbi:MAG: CRISPR-associated protein Cas4 [Candidatus Methanoperedens sp.]|nr:CRISPR-associated protein Cas4 [Candidatus Methanoperedens sp.]